MARKLDKRNGLYKYIDTMVQDGLEVYYEVQNSKLTIYYDELKQGLTYEQFKFAILRYIDQQKLQDAYKYISVIGG